MRRPCPSREGAVAQKDTRNSVSLYAHSTRSFRARRSHSTPEFWPLRKPQTHNDPRMRGRICVCGWRSAAPACLIYIDKFFLKTVTG